MYKADGLDLAKSSYKLLKELSELEDGKLRTFSEEETSDVSVLNRLLELGLVRKGPWGDGKASFAITRLGRDFIEDLAEESRLAEAERSRREKHDMETANRSGLFGLAGVVLGFVLSLLMALVTGQVLPIAP